MMRIAYVCHAGQDTGYGRAATELALALLEAGVDLYLFPINPALSSFESGPAAALRDRVGCETDVSGIPGYFHAAIVHTLPLDCDKALSRLLDTNRFFRDHCGARTAAIAYTTVETMEAPPAVEAKFGVQGVWSDLWVPSEANARAFDIDTFVLPHTFTPRPRDEAQPDWDDPNRRYRFYYMGAFNARKNVHGLIRAYVNEFTPDNLVELVIHSPGLAPERFIATLAQTGLEQADLPLITLSNKALSDEEVWRFHNRMDCFVTATRGEAWCLPAFEAMLARRHIIVPERMGQDDFLENTSAIRVRANMQPAFVDVEMYESTGGAVSFRTVGAQGLSARCAWLDPNLCDLADAMGAAFADKSTRLDVDYEPEDAYSHASVATMAIDRIKTLIRKE